MKIAYTIGTPETNGPMFAYQGDLGKILEELKSIGYDGIEPFVRNPKDMDIGNFVKLVEKSGLEVAAVGTAPIIEDKLTLTDNSAEVRKAAIARVKDIVDFASVFGAKVNIGKSRGVFPEDKKDEAWKWLQQGMEDICEYAGQKGLSVAIEPQNKKNINNLNTTQEGLSWIENTGINNLFILLDTYHMCVEDISIVASLVEANTKNCHMHIADSNRGIPGQGSIDFVEVLMILKALKYDGYLSLEIAQLPDPSSAARQSWEYLNRIRMQLD
ncbi:MAG: hypothetical protein APF84_01970 [Gracilibacter sp. BRH_c7a]|nr:MAG: hypothetical protein APF84_01970 [Gracilibacter sp. BRH_c7a]